MRRLSSELFQCCSSQISTSGSRPNHSSESSHLPEQKLFSSASLSHLNAQLWYSVPWSLPLLIRREVTRTFSGEHPARPFYPGLQPSCGHFCSLLFPCKWADHPNRQDLICKSIFLFIRKKQRVCITYLRGRIHPGKNLITLSTQSRLD